MSNKLKFGIAGAVAGLVNGLLGAGGGLLLIPLMKNWCGLDTHKAFATSVAIILPLCAVSAVVYLLKGNGWPDGAWGYLAGGLFGGIAGGFLLGRLPKRLISFVFAGVMLYSGFRMIFG